MVTAALPYANGPLHVGHLSGAYLPADIYTRFRRQLGQDVVFVCGSDEHGAAITMRAIKEGTTPQNIIDKYHLQFEKTFAAMGISFDQYHRTSSPLHHETSQEFFRTLYDKGAFIEKTQEQYFDEEAGQFLADRYIMGTCPKCDFPEAYGDQCENCGSSLSTTELIDPISKLSGAKPILKETTHWYLSLDKNEEWLKDFILEGKDDDQDHHVVKNWKNHVLGQCKSWLEEGLQPRAMTRDLDWGVDVPQEIKGAAGKKLYVWLDAPIGYISATKAWALENKASLELGEEEWKKYWQDNETALVHFIGKDNIVFHCIIFPSILKEMGDYILPENVPANQFMNLEGDKISTSRNWAIWVHEFVEEMPEYIDVLRYYLSKNMPEQRDSEFTWQSFQEANNNDLVNNLANFVQRVFVLTNKYFDGVLPEIDEDTMIAGPEYSDETSFVDNELLRLFDMMADVRGHMTKYEFRAALKIILEISTCGNQILQNNEPWKKVESDPEQVKAVLFICMQIVYALAHLIEPFMPKKSAELKAMLNLEQEMNIEEIMFSLAEGKFLLSSGHKIGKPKHLFQRLDDAFVEKQKEKLAGMERKPMEKNGSAVSDQKIADIKSDIDFDTFASIDLRTGVILTAEKVKKADKLLKLTVDIGSEQRTVVSGIAQHYTPEDIIGQQVVLVANLAPKRLRGVDSHGMVLMSEDTSGKLHFVQPSTAVENGSEVR